MRGDTRSLIHGIINLIVPFFIYDLAQLLVSAVTAANYDPWLAFWPMQILLWLPFLIAGILLALDLRCGGRRALQAPGTHPCAAGADLLAGRRRAVLHAAVPDAVYPVPAAKSVLTEGAFHAS